MRQNLGFSRVLRRFGKAVRLYDRDGALVGEGKAFLQAISERDAWQFSPTVLGVAREERFLYLGEAALALRADEGLLLCCDGISYRIARAQPVFVGKTCCHWRAILRLQEEVAH